MDLRCAVRADDGRLLAALTGQLDISTVAQVRSFLFKCLVEQPTALLVDLSGVVVTDALAAAVFTSVTRQAAMWPGTPVLFCAPSRATAALLSYGAYRRLPIFATVDQARDEVRHHRRVQPSLSDELLPVTGAPRQGRNLATEACARWDLPDLVGPACLVAGELISNGVDHAGTMLTLRLSVSARYLHIAVRDGSPDPPVLRVGAPADAPRGRGLRLVDAVAGSWGHLPADGGKVVWASLPVEGAGGP